MDTGPVWAFGVVSQVGQSRPGPSSPEEGQSMGGLRGTVCPSDRFSRGLGADTPLRGEEG